MQRKYVKWLLGLDRTTPNHIDEEETRIKSIKIEAIKRAIKYEEKARMSNKQLVKLCIEKREREWGAGREGKWAKIRNGLLKNNGYNKETTERSRREGVRIEEEVVQRVIEKEKEERRTKVRESNYN